MKMCSFFRIHLECANFNMLHEIQPAQPMTVCVFIRGRVLKIEKQLQYNLDDNASSKSESFLRATVSFES